MLDSFDNHTLWSNNFSDSQRPLGSAVWILVKGPLKYLVAKLHGCYPRAISLPVSQNILVRFSSAGLLPIQVAGDCFFTSLQHHKKNFSFIFLLINFLLCGYNM